MSDEDRGPISRFLADDLRPAKRFITFHDKSGKGIFVGDDSGDHHRVMVRGRGVANIIYSTSSNPVDMNDEADIVYARNKEPGIHVPNGSVARLIDFAPGVESPLHRAMSLDYGVEIEGVFELTLDSGESRIMHPGDVSVNRGTAHRWRNVNVGRSSRALFVLLDCKPLFVEGKEIKEDLGDLTSEYADLGQH